MRFIPFANMRLQQAPVPLILNRVYTYQAGGGGLRTKAMRQYAATYNSLIVDNGIFIGGCSPPFLPALCFTGSVLASNSASLNNSLIGTNTITVQREIRMDGGVGTGILSSHTVEIYVNSVFITSQTDSTTYAIPVTPGNLLQSLTFTGITLNNNDTIEIKWIDNIPT